MLTVGKDKTATECIELERIFYEEANKKLNAIWDPVLEPMLKKMLEIANENTSR